MARRMQRTGCILIKGLRFRKIGKKAECVSLWAENWRVNGIFMGLERGWPGWRGDLTSRNALQDGGALKVCEGAAGDLRPGKGKCLDWRSFPTFGRITDHVKSENTALPEEQEDAASRSVFFLTGVRILWCWFILFLSD